jgi:hypothetical protein
VKDSANLALEHVFRLSSADVIYACALLSTGHVECWGTNGEGELGNGKTTNSDTPVEVSGITDATQVSAGAGQTCALLATGHIDCWGYNESGQLGDVPQSPTGPRKRMAPWERFARRQHRRPQRWSLGTGQRECVRTQASPVFNAQKSLRASTPTLIWR